MNTYTVTDPAGVVHTRNSAARTYTHALIRKNVGSDTYFVNWATSEAKALQEARVHAGSRSYIRVVDLAVPAYTLSPEYQDLANCIAGQAEAIGQGKIPADQLNAQVALLENNIKTLRAWTPVIK